MRHRPLSLRPRLLLDDELADVRQWQMVRLLGFDRLAEAGAGEHVDRPLR